MAQSANMSLGEARAILAETVRRAELREPQYIRDLTPAQRKFYEDPARFKALLCGRRAGKTTVCIRTIRQRLEANPGTIGVFMGLTKASAKNLAWEPMKELVRDYPTSVGDWKFNKVETQAYLPNGSQFWVVGADKQGDIEKLRGPKYLIFVIDEAASYRAHLKDLIEKVVTPALGDLRGELFIAGTPGYQPAGVFYNVTTHQPGQEYWSVHSFTVLDNTEFDDPEGWLADERAKRGLTVDSPIYRIEYMGEWFLDTSDLVYRWDPERNGVLEPPRPMREYHLTLSMDFGFVDATAFVVSGYHDHDPNVVIFEAYKQDTLVPSEAADHAQMLRLRFARARGLANPDHAFARVVGDTAGAGIGYSREMEKRHGIWVEPAKKREKLAFIRHMNSDLLSGRLKVVMPTCRALIREWERLPWLDEEHEKYDERKFDDHIADAALYGWRENYHFRSTHEPNRPEPGTREAIEAEVREEEQRAIDRARRRHEDPLGLYGLEEWGEIGDPSW